MRYTQWIIGGLILIAFAIYQYRDKLAADNWAGLPFFLVPLLLGFGAIAALMIRLSGKRKGDRKKPQNSKAAPEIHDTSDRPTNPAGAKAGPGKHKPSRPLVRGEVIYRRIGIVVLLLTIFPASLVGLHVTQEMEPSWRLRCNLDFLQHQVDQHNQSVWREQQRHETSAARRLQTEQEVERLQRELQRLNEIGEHMKSLEVQSEIQTKQMELILLHSSRFSATPNTLRIWDTEREQCLMRQSEYDAKYRNAVLMGIGAFIAIVVLVLGLLKIGLSVVRSFETDGCLT
ncbi:MAG: hypothetical protein ACK4MQ_12805 [Hyphomonas sp.]